MAAGFSIEKLIEPIPTEELLLEFPDQRDLFHKPDFLLVRGRKVILCNGNNSMGESYVTCEN